MVDFSKREDVKRWLDRIEPADRRREVAIVMAARAALRFLPLGGSGQTKPNMDRFADIVLPIFRASALPWVAGKYPAHGDELRSAVFSAAFSVSITSHTLSDYFAAAEALPAEALGGFSAAQAAHAALSAVSAATTSNSTYSASAAVVAVGAAATAAAVADAAWIDIGQTAVDLAGAPLWQMNVPDWAKTAWQSLRTELLADNEDWQVWIHWYEARLVVDQRNVPNEELELARALIDGKIWDQGPRAVNAEIARLIELHAPKPPPAPDSILGSALSIVDGRLTLTNIESAGDFDQNIQRALHRRIQALFPSLLTKSKQVGNTHPGLLAITAEYAELIDEPIEKLDVVALWAVGAGLIGAADTLNRSQQAGVMQEPLEPEHLLLLKQVATVHGGFILGFELGRELTERADRARVPPETLSNIIPPARDLLGGWSRQTRFVEERTRQFFAALSSTAVEPSWRIARSGYSVYAFTRDALIVLGKFALTTDRSASSSFLLGTAITIVHPQFATEIQAIADLLLANAPNVLAFSEPFPELKFWLTEILQTLKKDSEFRAHSSNPAPTPPQSPFAILPGRP